MALSEEENVCPLLNFDCGCLKGCHLVNFGDFRYDNKCCEDIADLLPNDPFEMEFNMGVSSDEFHKDFSMSLPRDPFGMDFDIDVTFEAITGWIEEFGLRACGFETEESAEDNGGDGDNGSGDNRFFAELNFVWTGSMKYEQEGGENEVVDDGSMMCVEDLKCFGCEKYEIEPVKNDVDADGSVAVDTIIFVLEHLSFGVKDLLSIGMVCKSFRDAVRRDPYLWTKIHIDYPMSLVITDDDLLGLTDKAQGKLCSLTLLKCLYITNDGLKQVLERNLGVTKLSLAGCVKFRGEGLLKNLKAYNSVATPGIKCLRIGPPLDITHQQFKEFKRLLGEDEDAKPKKYKPRYYRIGEIYLSLDDERAIDLETCPRCHKLEQVYDCPAENCQLTTQSSKTCRACTFCVARCIRCGCCLDNRRFQETFCFDYLCFDCLEEVFLTFKDTLPSSPTQIYFYQAMDIVSHPIMWNRLASYPPALLKTRW